MMNQEAEESRAVRGDESLLSSPPAGASALPRGPPGWSPLRGRTGRTAPGSLPLGSLVLP